MSKKNTFEPNPKARDLGLGNFPFHFVGGQITDVFRLVGYHLGRGGQRFTLGLGPASALHSCCLLGAKCSPPPQKAKAKIGGE